MTRSATFTVYRSGSKFRWRLRSGNGEIVAQGQSHTTKRRALSSIAAMRKLAPFALTEDTTARVRSGDVVAKRGRRRVRAWSDK